MDDPAKPEDSAAAGSGQVIMSQAQYDELRRKAESISPSGAAQGEAPAPKKPKYPVGLLLVLALLLSFVVPGLGWLCFVVIALAVLTPLGFFKSEPGKKRNPVTTVFKALAALAITALAVIG